MCRFLLSFLLSFVCFSARAVAHQVPAPDTTAPSAVPHVFTKDMTIFVRDFDLNAANVQADQGGMASGARPGILGRRRRELNDPSTEARRIVTQMSNELVADLHQAGYKALRLDQADTRPASGMIVQGVFTEFDEGNRLHRALIGFGSGNAKMNLYVTMADLAAPDKPLYNMQENATSGNKAGAAISLNPYAAAAKFVLDKNAPEKMVKKTASQIASAIVKRFQQPGSSASASPA